MRQGRERLTTLVDLGIGWGHPTLQDALLWEARRQGLTGVETIDLSTQGGYLVRAALALVEQIYRQGGQGPVRQRVYEALRGWTPRQDGRLNQLVAQEIESLLGGDGLVIATHEMVVSRTRKPDQDGQGRLCLAQVDIQVPGNVVHGADAIFVPVQDSVEYLSLHGVPEERVKTVGFLVHPVLLDELKQKDPLVRKERLCHGPLRLGMMLSGARPHRHKEAIMAGLASCRDLIKDHAWQVTVVPMDDGGFGRQVEAFARQELGLKTGFDHDTAPDGPWQVRIILPRPSKEEMIRVSHQLAAEFDVLFGPLANERFPWPVCLATLPNRQQIGHPSKRNLTWLEARGLVLVVHNPRTFGDQLVSLMTSTPGGLVDQLDKRLDLNVSGAATIWKELGDVPSTALSDAPES